MHGCLVGYRYIHVLMKYHLFLCKCAHLKTDTSLKIIDNQNLSQGPPPYRVDCVVYQYTHKIQCCCPSQSDKDFVEYTYFAFQYTVSPPDPPSNLDEPMESISSMKMIEGACSLLKRRH